jgi:hypothetical protein
MPVSSGMLIVAGWQLRAGPAGRECGCRPQRCSRRTRPRCRSPSLCGSARSRCTSGAAPGGPEALASKGPGGSPLRLDETQLAELRAALKAGPAAHGWAQGPAVDPGPRSVAGLAAVRGLLHAARDVVPAAPDRLFAPGPGPPGGGTGRGRDRGVAYGDLGQGTRLAVLAGTWMLSRTRPGSRCGHVRPAPGRPAVTPR